jgi:predicted DNA-binding ribbon-helix-helix protein
MAASRLVNRNITAGGGRTSMRLEPEVWDALREICLREGMELRELIQLVEKTAPEGCRTSAVRVHVLTYFRSAATEEGHSAARHGLDGHRHSSEIMESSRRHGGEPGTNWKIVDESRIEPGGA